MKRATNLFRNLIITPSSSSLCVGSIVQVEDMRVQVLKQLAQGGFAFVYLVKDIRTDEQFALKRLLVNDNDDLAKVKEEIEFMKMIPNHKNIVQYRSSAIQSGVNRPETEIFIVMEFCPGASLYEVLDQRYKRYFQESEIWDIFAQITDGIAHLHSLSTPITHRDLKVENVLQCGDKWKLCDFGSATVKTYLPSDSSSINRIEDEIGRFTTMAYRSPEMIDLWRKQLINHKADIWALGCLLYRLCFFHHPFEDGGNLQILNVKYQIPRDSPYSEELHAMIRYMIEPDPEKRPDIKQVIQRFSTIRGTSYSFSSPLDSPVTRSPAVTQKSNNHNASLLSTSSSSKASSSTNFFDSIFEDNTSSSRSTASIPTTSSSTNFFDATFTNSNTTTSNSSAVANNTTAPAVGIADFADFSSASFTSTVSADTTFFAAPSAPSPVSTRVASPVTEQPNFFSDLFSAESSNKTTNTNNISVGLAPSPTPVSLTHSSPALNTSSNSSSSSIDLLQPAPVTATFPSHSHSVSAPASNYNVLSGLSNSINNNIPPQPQFQALPQPQLFSMNMGMGNNMGNMSGMGNNMNAGMMNNNMNMNMGGMGYANNTYNQYSPQASPTMSPHFANKTQHYRTSSLGNSGGNLFDSVASVPAVDHSPQQVRTNTDPFANLRNLM